MKKCSIWNLMMLMALPMITACGGDDDSDGNTSNKSKHISKMVVETDGAIRESIFTYDTQDRVIEMKMTTNSSSTTDGVYAKTYQYGETLIIEKEVLNGNLSYDQFTGYPRTHTYTLSNGLIVKDTETRNGISRYILFTYDNDGNLKTISEYDNGERVKSLSWSNGMLSKIEGFGVTLRAYTYSDIPWKTGMIFDLIPYTDDILLAMGYYGKLPKSLPSGFEDDSYQSFQYTLSGDLVTKIVTSKTDKSVQQQTSVATIIWE